MIGFFEVAGYTLLDPWFLLGAPLCLLLAAWRRLRPRAALPAASLAGLAALPTTLRARCVSLPLWIEALAGMVLCIALARPVEREVVPLRSEGVDIVLLVDISSSMQLNDMDDQHVMRRVDAARQRASEFELVRKNDRIGLVTFSRYAELRCPLTLDHQALATFLAAIDTVAQNSELDGTAIGTALAKASQVLHKGAAKSKVVVLLTDGENNLGDITPEDGTKLCADAGIRVYTIGLGNGLPVFGGFRPTDFSELQTIATATGGKFFAARSDADLGQVYDAIDQLEKQPLEDPRYRTVDRFALPLCGGLLLLALALLLEFSWLRGVP